MAKQSIAFEHITEKSYKGWGLIDLPFVADINGERCFWNIPEVKDYGEACLLGQSYATHLLQYLKDNPETRGAGYIGWITKDMDVTDETDAKGIMVGFFSLIGLAAFQGVKDADIWHYLDQSAQSHIEMQEKEKKNKQRTPRNKKTTVTPSKPVTAVEVQTKSDT